MWSRCSTTALAPLLIALLLTACSRAAPLRPLPAPAPTGAPPTFVTLPAAQALPALVAAERNAAAARDLTTLQQLWAEDAVIIDSRGTANPTDDYRWQGRAAILDRYLLAVFPAPPPPVATAPRLAFVSDGHSVTATAGIDRWRFTFAAGRWWLQELAY